MPHSRLPILITALCAAPLALAAPVAAPDSAAAKLDPAQRFESAPDAQGKLSLPYAVSVLSQRVVVVARLAGDPISVVQAKQGRPLSVSEKQQIRASLKSQQAAVRPNLQALGASVLYEFQNSLNGIKVDIARGQLDALAHVPGVVAVLPVATHYPNHQNSMPLIGAPTVWDPAGGNFHGEGIKVAVVDTGIDYTHANFGGPGTVAAWQNAFAHSTTAADPALFGPGAPKVKGGTDLVGDDYDAGASDPAARVPHPDPNPLDCAGHGSHVSGTVGGFGVLTSGATFTGPYDASTLPDNTFNVAPGAAPRADLYAVRVFGCAGSTNVVDQAIEWAVDNDMQVISMSLGSDFGGADSSDAVASTNAAKAGVIVVAAAGNAGPNPYIVGAPSVGDDVISVAAIDSTPSFPAAILNLSTGRSLTAINANGATPLPSGAIPIVVLRNANGTVSLGCDPQEYVNANVAGKLAVTARGVCARVARAIYGQQAGAVAVAMINNAAGLPPFEGTITSNPDTGQPYLVTIPFLGVQGTGPDPTNLVAADGGTTTLTATVIPNPGFEVIASFSSGGPRLGDLLLKPDVTAPGVSILSTLIGSGTQGTRLSGTSMATPHTSGVSALALQAHPNWSPTDVRRAVVNTTDPSKVVSYNTRLAGGGLIQAPPAVLTDVVASTDQGTHLGFGFAEIKSDLAKSKAIKLRNNGSAAATFNVSVTNKQGESHTAVPSASQVTVAPGQAATVNLALTVPAASVRNDASFRQVAGVVTFTPVGGSNNGASLRVPYYLVARGLSNVSAKLAPAPTMKNPSGTVTLSNTGGPISGNADFYALGIAAANQQNLPYAVHAMGIQSFSAPTGTNPTRQLLVAAINTWNRWNSASTLEFDTYIDVDGDGVADYIVFAADFGLVTTGSFDGRFGVFIYTIATGEVRSSGFLAAARSDNSTALLPFFSSDLCRPGAPCFSTANPRMTYEVIGFDLFTGASSQAPGAGRYNPWTPAISQGDFVTLAPNQSGSSAVSVDTTEWAQTPALGVMVVSTDNKAGSSEAAALSFTLK